VSEIAVASAPPRAIRAIARGSTLNFVGLIIAGALGFVLTVVITRGLGGSGAGVFFSAAGVFTILANVTELGADTGAVRFVSRLRAQGRSADIKPLLLAAVVPAALAGIVAAIVCLAFAGPFAEVFAKDRPDDVAAFLRLIAPFLPFATVASVAIAATRGFGTMKPFVAIESVGKPALKPLLIAVVAAGGLTTAEVAVAWGAPEAVACAAALVVAGRLVLARPTPTTESTTEQRARPVGELAREFWRFSATRGVAAAFQVSVLWFDVLLLGRYRPSADVGIYGAASRMVTMGTFALQAIRLAIAPQIAALLARDDRAEAQTVYQTATWWLMAVSWPLFLTLAVFAPLVLGIFGPGYSRGDVALVILSLAMLVNLGTGNVTVVLLMGGKSSWNLVNTAVALTLNVVLNLVLMPRFGMEGAAVAWAVSIVVDNLLALIEVRVFLGMRPFGSGYLPVAAAAVGCVGGGAILARALLGPTALGLLVSVLVGAPLYVAVLWQLRGPLHLDAFLASLRGGRDGENGDGEGRRGGPAGSPDGPPRRSGGVSTPTVVKAAGRSALRAAGTATADLRPPPDFLVIGTKRGGTTSLSSYLMAHPSVTPLFPARIAPKGVRYFDEHPDRSVRWYRSHFATALSRGPALRPRKLAGESTANYLFHPLAAERAATAAPDAKIVVLVRDPVDRAWSHWRERTRRGNETLSFEEALMVEDDRLSEPVRRIADDPAYGTDVANIAYRAQGRYADLLPAWLERFGDRVLVLVSEDMYTDPAGTYASVLTFLGLPHHDLGTYRAFNYHPPREGFDPATRAELEAFFEPHNRRLETLLGRDLPWSHRRSS
jgi:O-antigen/teichoic acid export membrane protein